MHYVVKKDGQYGYLEWSGDREELKARLEAAGGKLMAKKSSQALAVQAAQNLQHAENVRVGTRTLGGPKKGPLGISSITIDPEGNVVAAEFQTPQEE